VAEANNKNGDKDMTIDHGGGTGEIHFVGAGPGDPDLLTLKAARLLRSADVVLHDDLVPAAILQLVERRAMLVSVGKRCGAKRITQHEINHVMVEFARRGLEVVRLKSGDPGVFGRLGEELEALDAAGISWEIVPGVTAAVAAAASIGTSLTDRRNSSQLLIVSGHSASPEMATGATDRVLDTVDWAHLIRNGTTVALYMPGQEFARLRVDLLTAGADPETPTVVVSRASRPDQRLQHTTLARLEAYPELPTPTILLVGKALERAVRSNWAGDECVPESLIQKGTLTKNGGPDREHRQFDSTRKKSC
jgi:uroporphyrin-III C-methyltransferase